MARVVWPELKASKGRRLARLIRLCWLGFMLAAMVCVFVGLVFQAIETRRDLRDYPAPGLLVDVGGHRLHAQVKGEGSPVVILESGWNSTSLDWELVIDEVAKFTTVVAYDRAGMGWSDPGPSPRTSFQIAEELYWLLQKAEIEGPYILVGHSMGGFSCRMFARNRGEDVAGMVLVDASHEDQELRLKLALGRTEGRPDLGRILGLATLRTLKLLNYMGFTRMAVQWEGARSLLLGEERVARLAPETQAQILRHVHRPKTFGTLADELAAFDQNAAWARQTRAAVQDVPLVVVTRGQEEEGIRVEANEIWQGLQTDLVSLSSQSKQVVAQDSGHFITLEQPGVVVQSIRDMVMGHRSGKTRRGGSARGLVARNDLVSAGSLSPF